MADISAEIPDQRKLSMYSKFNCDHKIPNHKIAGDKPETNNSFHHNFGFNKSVILLVWLIPGNVRFINGNLRIIMIGINTQLHKMRQNSIFL